MTDEERRISDQNKQVMQRFYDEVASGGNIDRVDELLGPDFVEHEEFPGLTPDREGVKQFFAGLHGAFPDVSFTVEDMVGEGDVVSARVTIRGTHTGGEFMGIPAGGKSIETQGMDFVRFADGLGTEHWGVGDMVTMLQQLGAMPAPS